MSPAASLLSLLASLGQQGGGFGQWADRPLGDALAAASDAERKAIDLEAKMKQR